MKTHSYLPSRCTVCLAISNLALPLAASADSISDWNKFAFETIKAGGFNSNLGTRIGAIQSITGVQIKGQPGQSYRLEYTSTLPEGTWIPWKYVTLTGADSGVIPDSSSFPKRFYRAVPIANAP